MGLNNMGRTAHIIRNACMALTHQNFGSERNSSVRYTRLLVTWRRINEESAHHRYTTAIRR